MTGGTTHALNPALGSGKACTYIGHPLPQLGDHGKSGETLYEQNIPVRL